MAQLFFIYGTMNCGKSTQLLSTAHSYREQGKKPLLLTPETDVRFGEGIIESRIGLSEKATIIKSDTDLRDPNIFFSDYDVILVDESQFLTASQVDDLAYIVDKFSIPVLAYGLKNDFSNHLFPGSEHLLITADKLIEMKTTCRWCNHKATMNLRITDDKPVYDGEQIILGDNEPHTNSVELDLVDEEGNSHIVGSAKANNTYYVSVCRHHYYQPEL